MNVQCHSNASTHIFLKARGATEAFRGMDDLRKAAVPVIMPAPELATCCRVFSDCHHRRHVCVTRQGKGGANETTELRKHPAHRVHARVDDFTAIDGGCKASETF